MQMLAERKFPTDNICLKLCLDVARWYGVQNTSQMRYQAETKRLWTIGYTLFYEKCVRYMSGYKNAPPGYGWGCAAVNLRPRPLIRANFW